MKYTLLVESESLLEAKHKCVLDVSTLLEFKQALIVDLGLSLLEGDLRMELFDSEFEVRWHDTVASFLLTMHVYVPVL